tara:strand:+ start:100 stop:363 length:264 start_codon:yes stop_codon:yes gene_type:complete
MKKEVIENNVLIATRIAPGDSWKLTTDPNTVYKSLTDALEAYFQETGNRCEFRLAPLDSKLYAIGVEEHIIEEPQPKKLSIYGEYEF